jgi:nucleoside 2-deoxyribosyltransferase
VFLPDAVDFGQRKVEMCGRYGLTGLYPLDNSVDLAADDVSLSIFKGNVGMMNEAVAIIANLTPFRGVSADPGTAFELGYMAGRGKLCLGYSNDGSIYIDRVRRAGEVRAGNGGLVDARG